MGIFGPLNGIRSWIHSRGSSVMDRSVSRYISHPLVLLLLAEVLVLGVLFPYRTMISVTITAGIFSVVALVLGAYAWSSEAVHSV